MIDWIDHPILKTKQDQEMADRIIADSKKNIEVKQDQSSHIGVNKLETTYYNEN